MVKKRCKSKKLIFIAFMLLFGMLGVLAFAGGQKEGKKAEKGKAAATVVPAGVTKIIYWEFFGGGDGIRMKQIVDDFNKSQNKLFVEMSTLAWGEPFYTKVHTAVVAGKTPDVMSYHLSHFPAGVKDLRPFTESELANAGMPIKDFNPEIIKRSLTISKAYGTPGVLYGVPIDTHTLVLYYNKDLLKKAGLLGPDGKPIGLNGIDNFTRALKQIKDKTGILPIATANDPASVWRIWYTLFKQQGGKLVKNGNQVYLNDIEKQGKKSLQVMVNWTKDGLVARDTSYPAMVALFSAGRSAFMINGNWEVPTMVDLQKKGKLSFKYGIMAFPKLYNNQDTWADSHNLAIPNNTKNPISKEKLKDVLIFIAYLEKNSLIWAGGGHIPMWLPVTESSAYKQLVPNNEYSSRAIKDAVYEPINPIFGVGNPTYDTVGNFLTPALTGKLTIDQAITKFKQRLKSFLK